MTRPSADTSAGFREQLVAYLDGELDEARAAAVERRLRHDPRLRREAEQLDRTWSLLDVLEPVTAGSHFSQQTVQTVVAECAPAAGSVRSPWRRLWSQVLLQQAAGWFLIGMLGTAAGLGVSLLRGEPAVSQRSEAILRNLDMLRRYPDYARIPSVDALRQLARLRSKAAQDRETAP